MNAQTVSVLTTSELTAARRGQDTGLPLFRILADAAFFGLNRVSSSAGNTTVDFSIASRVTDIIAVALEESHDIVAFKT